MKGQFYKGIRHGIPVMLGYLSVSFGFGILCIRSGLSAVVATLISATNLTSAGQTAGVLVIAAGGTLVEMMATQFVINLRYSLMAVSLSQKLAPSFSAPHRLLTAYGITDEIFAIASSQPGLITPAYLYGIILVSTLGWTSGTALGAFAGELLPATVSDAMGILLYGMFFAILIPPARRERRILTTVLLAAAISVCLHYGIPAFPSGFAVISSAVISAAFTAMVFPMKEEDKL